MTTQQPRDAEGRFATKPGAGITAPAGIPDGVTFAAPDVGAEVNARLDELAAALRPAYRPGSFEEFEASWRADHESGRVRCPSMGSDGRCRCAFND